MTSLNGDARVVRQTAVVYRGEPLGVELGAFSLRLRPKRARYGYEVDYLSIFHLGARKEAERLRAERWETRRRRKERG